MQKSRLMYSPTSDSSRSNNTLKIQKASKARSTGGDCAEENENNKIFESIINSTATSESTKYNMRRRNVKSSKKTPKPNRPLRPTLRSLKNAIVLAPFHTLKRCFQSKLVNLYSYEKLKKKNKKERLARKQNLAFEYEVFELNPLQKKNLKKLENNCKFVKRKGNQNEEQSKRKSNKFSKFGRYCKCPKNDTRMEGKSFPKSLPNIMKNQKKLKKPSISYKEHSFMPESLQELTFRNRPNARKTKFHQTNFPTDILKNDFENVPNYINFDMEKMSDTMSTVMETSSVSNFDSWEGFSGAPYREEHLEGSLVISATSFDSCMEEYAQERNDDQIGKSSKSKRKMNNRLHSQHDKLKKQSKQKSGHQKTYLYDLGADFSPSAKVNDPSHLIMNVRMKDSDGLIADFIDRESRAEQLSSLEISQHIQPLRLPKKTKTKKQKNYCETTKLYYLRSATASSERIQSYNEEDESLRNSLDVRKRASTTKSQDTFDNILQKNLNMIVEMPAIPQNEEIKITIIESPDQNMDDSYFIEKTVIEDANDNTLSNSTFLTTIPSVEYSKKSDNVSHSPLELQSSEITNESVVSGNNINMENSSILSNNRLGKTSVEQSDKNGLQSKETNSEINETGKSDGETNLDEKFNHPEKETEPPENLKNLSDRPLFELKKSPSTYKDHMSQ